MKHLNGKRLKLWDSNGHLFEGLCTGATDEIVKLLKDGEKDERVFFVKNIYSYTVVGGGVTGGYSGLFVYTCRNPNINCKGKCMISANECHIEDMDCDVCRQRTAQGIGFKCDFGQIGAMEIIPPQVQKALFNGMRVDLNRKRNYLEEAKKEIEREMKKERKE